MTEYKKRPTKTFVSKVVNQLLNGTPIPKAVKVKVVTSEAGEYELSIAHKEKTEELTQAPFYKGVIFRANDITDEARTYSKAYLVDEDGDNIVEVGTNETKDEGYIAIFEFEFIAEFEAVCHEAL